MSLHDHYFSGDVEDDVAEFASKLITKRVLVFPPVDNYRRFLIHRLVQDRFANLLHTFSIGQGIARRTVVCFKTDLISDSKTMGVEQRSPAITPEHNTRQRPVKSVPTVEIYRPPAARRAAVKEDQTFSKQDLMSPESADCKSTRQRRPDRAVYVPRHRRDTDEIRETPQKSHTSTRDRTPKARVSSTKLEISSEDCDSDHNFECQTENLPLQTPLVPTALEEPKLNPEQTVGDDSTNEVEDKTIEGMKTDCKNSTEGETSLVQVDNEADDKEGSCEREEEEGKKCEKVLVISDKASQPQETDKQVPVISMTPPEKKVKKVERPKSKPAPPPSPPIKINRDECDWESLFDDNGDCLDPTLIEELTSAVGEVMIEQPKNSYKSYSKPVEVSNDEYAHVIEIYNFPSEFKTSDLAAVFSPFSGGFELKWVDDTHCLGVFSSALIAARVLASEHPFVKTRPLSEATTLSKTKARKSSEFLLPYKSRPETCAALARRLVTGALGVRLATARQEREHEKIILREAKEKRRLANKQREDAWEGVIAQK